MLWLLKTRALRNSLVVTEKTETEKGGLKTAAVAVNPVHQKLVAHDCSSSNLQLCDFPRSANTGWLIGHLCHHHHALCFGRDFYGTTCICRSHWRSKHHLLSPPSSATLIWKNELSHLVIAITVIDLELQPNFQLSSNTSKKDCRTKLLWKLRSQLVILIEGIFQSQNLRQERGFAIELRPVHDNIQQTQCPIFVHRLIAEQKLPIRFQTIVVVHRPYDHKRPLLDQWGQQGIEQCTTLLLIIMLHRNVNITSGIVSEHFHIFRKQRINVAEILFKSPHSFHKLISCSRVAGSKVLGFWSNLYQDLSPFSLEVFKSSRAFAAWPAAIVAASVARSMRLAISAPSIAPLGAAVGDPGFEGCCSIVRHKECKTVNASCTMPAKQKCKLWLRPGKKQTWYTSRVLCVCPHRLLRVVGLRYHNSFFFLSYQNLGVSSLCRGHAFHDLPLKQLHLLYDYMYLYKHV